MKPWVIIVAGASAAVVGAALVMRRSSRSTSTGSAMLVTGDSLALGLGTALTRARADVTAAAVVGETPDRTLALLHARLAAAPTARTVIVWTGTNWLTRRRAAEIARVIDAIKLAASATGRRVIVVGLPEHARGAAEVNAIIRPDVSGSVASSLVAGDGLHLTAAGYVAVARRLSA